MTTLPDKLALIFRISGDIYICFPLKGSVKLTMKKKNTMIAPFPAVFCNLKHLSIHTLKKIVWVLVSRTKWMKSTFSHYSQLPQKPTYYWLNPCWIEISSDDTFRRRKGRANSIELRNLLFSQQRSYKSIKIQNQGKRETIRQERLSMGMKLLLVIFRLVN